MAKKYLDTNGLLYFWQKITNTFVKKDGSKVLSTNDYTTEEKTKLAGIEEGANKIVVDTALSSSSSNPVENKVVNAALGGKVDKVDGKGLSTNDLTNALVTKINETADKVDDLTTVGGEPNVINTVKVNGVALTVSGKAVDVPVPTNNNQLENGAGYITEINSDNVIDALGYTPYDSTNPNGFQTANQVETRITNKGYITGINSDDVTTALGFVPYNVTNPEGFQTADQVNDAIQAIVGAAPEALNTLEELAKALNNNESFASAVTTELGKKVNEADIVAITNAEIDTIIAA